MSFLRTIGLAAMVVITFPCCKQRPQRGVEVIRGAAIYMEKCATCHGQNGVSPLRSCPPLRDSERLTGSNEPLIAILLDGLCGPLQVKGHTYNGLMPAWRTVLSDEEIASVLNFLRRQWSTSDELITSSTVAELRKRTDTRQTFWTDTELHSVWNASQTDFAGSTQKPGR
ncbi:cytochrome c, mono- and diheme variants [Terrimicrobium sacchariphilum]|uniref:Cytochrome c, mono-and diheme variants n=1 Tax=Terrimicrobium sacchariphilum TaxID=690879 RepID=A0A146GC23_TERSA|nr:cytochrome c [Terrimicrobium sacchariphilum]GAT34354.1 cytochrome c, mono- and diheme variants [Terrimicrobium sacchariphilum]